MAKASRDKGRVAEREVCAMFEARDISCRRLWEDQSKPGGQQDGDLRIDIPDPPYIEVRRREQLSIPAWLREIEEKTPDDEGVLIFRRNREPWYAAISLEYYIDLLKSRPTSGVGWPD